VRSTADGYLEWQLVHVLEGLEAGEIRRPEAALYLLTEAHAMRGDGASDFVVEQICWWAKRIANGDDLHPPAPPRLNDVLAAIRRA
jgi:hypothetical protein